MLVGAGPNRARPPSMVHNWDASCPELMCADPSECMDACAHDMWGVGRMLLRVLCNIAPWSVRTGCDQQDRATLCGLHDAWVCTAPATENHPDTLCIWLACLIAHLVFITVGNSTPLARLCTTQQTAVLLSCGPMPVPMLWC